MLTLKGSLNFKKKGGMPYSLQYPVNLLLINYVEDIVEFLKLEIRLILINQQVTFKENPQFSRINFKREKHGYLIHS